MINSFSIAHRKQAGITLVETAIALAIAAVVVSAAFAGFQANARRSEVRDNSQLISEMIADTKQLFGPSNRFGVLTTAKAMAARVIPTNMHSGTNAYNSYGGAVQITGGTDVGSTGDLNDQAKLVFSDVPRNQCVDLALSVERNLTGMVIVPSGTAATETTRAKSAETAAAKTNGANPGDVVTKVSDACVVGADTPATDTGKYDFHLFFARN